MSSHRELSGVLPVIQTPFDDGGEIDGPTLVDELRWVLDQGAAGLATGMVSEILRLSDAERHQISEAVVGVALERGVLSVISCGAASQRDLDGTAWRGARTREGRRRLSMQPDSFSSTRS